MRLRHLPLWLLAVLLLSMTLPAAHAAGVGALSLPAGMVGPPRVAPGLSENSRAVDDHDPADEEPGYAMREDLAFVTPPPLGDAGLAPAEADSAADPGFAGEAPVRSGVQTYTVKKGDTLGSISRKFFGSTKHWSKIAKANKIGDPKGLKVGRVIKIPTVGQRHRVTYAEETDGGIPPVTSYDAAPVSPPPLRLPPVISQSGPGNETVLYQDGGLPRVILPDTAPKDETSKRFVTLNGLTGLTQTIAGYTMGDGLFSTAFGVIWNKITRREGNRLKTGEDGDYWQFPIALTYAATSFEAALVLPFESYDVFAPISYNFRDGSDSGMGDVTLRLKFCTDNESMASALGMGAIFPTSDRQIGNTDVDNAWEVFGAISSKRKEGGNFHVNGGYQASDGNTDHEGVFFNVGFDYSANSQFTFMGEVNSYNRVNQGRSTDLTLSMRYYPRPGMALTLAAPIALNNDMYFGYDYRLVGQLQYRY